MNKPNDCGSILHQGVLFTLPLSQSLYSLFDFVGSSHGSSIFDKKFKYIHKDTDFLQNYL